MIHVQKYLLLFVRYSWLVVLVVAAAAGIEYLRVDRQPSIYGATAVMEVTAGASKVLPTVHDYQNDRIATMDVINTVVDTLSSNDVMLKVADAIGRTAEWAASSPSGKIPADKESSLAQSVRNQIRVSLRKGTRLIEVDAEDVNPAMARNIAQQTVDQFLKMHDYVIDADSDATVSSLEKKIKEQRDVLNEATAKLDKYTQEKNINLKKDPLAAEQITLLNTQLASASAKRSSLESDLAQVQAADPKDTETLLRIPAVEVLPEVAAIRGAIIEKESQFSIIKDRYLPKHPKYADAERALNEVRNRMATTLAGAGGILKRQLDMAETDVTRLKNSLKELAPKGVDSGDYVEVQTLQRAVEQAQKLYDDVTKRREEVKMSSDVEKKSPYRWASKPLLNPVALRPDKARALLNASLIGLVIAVGLILMIDRLDSSVRTVDEAENQLGLPVLAAVPEGDVSGIPKGGTVMTDAAGSAQAESFRTLRASLSLIGDESRRRVVLVTSAIPAEGKTFCSINLAACLAGQGFKTLLVDGDLRRPALSSTLLERTDRKAEQYRGLTDVLSGNCQPLEAIRPTSVPNLTLMPAGRKAPNPSELLAQATLPALLKYLEGHYDRIVFDTAPINAVSDTLGLSAQVQGVVMVLRFGKTPKRAIQRALNLLKKAGARMQGLVINRVPNRRGASYYYYYYGDPYLKDSVYGDTGGKVKKKRRKEEEPAPEEANTF